jgi:hypothetical protein
LQPTQALPARHIKFQTIAISSSVFPQSIYDNLDYSLVQPLAMVPFHVFLPVQGIKNT